MGVSKSLTLKNKPIFTQHSSTFSTAYKIVEKSNPRELWWWYVVRMKRTNTYPKEAYLASTCYSPLHKAELQGFQPEMEDMHYFVPHSGISGFISAIWFWLRACVYVVTGYGDPYEDEVEFVERPHCHGRARRHLEAHFAKRKDAVPARENMPFYYFGSRRITRAQFMERLCRLSGRGRIRVYRMIYYAHRLARYAKLAMFTRGDFRAPSGLCQAHLWPD